MFEEATRLKLRFNTVRGEVSVEDLWDMKLLGNNNFNLDELEKHCRTEVKESKEKSFVIKRTKKDSIADLKLQIVRHVITYKLQEAEKAEQRASNSKRKEQILSLIENKKLEQDKELSIEELTELANKL